MTDPHHDSTPDATPLILSVSGLRGWIGKSLTPEVAARYGAVLGDHFRQTSGIAIPRIVIGRDSRTSGEAIESAVVSGLIGTGCRVVRLGILSTPGVAIAVEDLKAQGGIVVTASHNPAPWNGIKALGADGLAPPVEAAEEIIARFHQAQPDWIPAEDYQPIEIDFSIAAEHVRRVLACVDVEAIRERRLRVVLDSVHGAGGPEALMLLEKLGVDLVHLHAEPTGRFPHEPEPTAANLTGLCDAVLEYEAELGFAQDPDADRLAIVDGQGRYIGEEYTLALAAEHIFSRHADDGLAVAATNLSTSRMIDDIATRCGGAVVRTPVGEASVAAAMRAEHAIIGGEGNGGVIWPAVAYVRDSLVGMALVLELLTTRDCSLADLVERLPRYAIVKTKQPIPADPHAPARIVQALRTHYADRPSNDSDGIRIDWSDRWLHVRASNTEPILRLIAEAPTTEDAQSLIDDAAHIIARCVNRA